MADGFDSAHTIVKNTENLLEEKSLLDFTVRVEDVELPCHRVILAASSHFFRALLMTDMKEAKEGYVTIRGISLDVFQIIFKSMYTGKITINLTNFILIWQAADQLQIDFIVGHCEDFAKKLICVETFDIMLDIANDFNSEQVWNALGIFLPENFDSISERHVKHIMELGFYDFDELIDSRDLNVRNEDWLIQLVLKWVEYVPDKDNSEDDEDECTDIQNDSIKGTRRDNNSDQKNKNQNKRLQRLAPLLKSVRTCLVSTPLLKHLLKHRLIINNTKARDILIDAVLYKTTHYNHGQWRTSAIHRASSQWEHCGIMFVINGGFLIFGTFDKKYYTCVRCNECFLDVTLVVFDSDLYISGVTDLTQTNCSFCVLSGNSWRKITEIPGRQLVLVPYDECIFIFSRTKPEIFQTFPKCGNPKVEEFTKLPDTIKVQLAINYRRMILVFSSVTVHDEQKTAVHQLDILTKKFTELQQLNGPADHLISFCDDNNFYVLQKCGDLWTIDYNAGKVTLQFLYRMWNTSFILHGAFSSKRHLRIAYPRFNNKLLENAIAASSHPKHYFKELSLWSFNDAPCSNYIPAVLPKNILKPVIEKEGNLFIE